MKHFSIIISDPCFVKNIDVDTNELITVQDLKVFLSKMIQIPEDQFTFNNSISHDQKLLSIPDNTKFDVKFLHKSNFLTFIFPDGSKIKVKSAAGMNVDSIINNFAKSGKVYYSEFFIKKKKTPLHFEIFGIKVPEDGFHIHDIPENIPINVIFEPQTVIIPFDNKQFILYENEYVERAIKLLEKAIGEKFTFTIRNLSLNVNIFQKHQLNAKIKYGVTCTAIYEFIPPVGKPIKPPPIDYYATFCNAREIIKQLYPIDIPQGKEIVFYVGDTRINNDNLLLKDLFGKGKFYFEILDKNQINSPSSNPSTNKAVNPTKTKPTNKPDPSQQVQSVPSNKKEPTTPSSPLKQETKPIGTIKPSSTAKPKPQPQPQTSKPNPETKTVNSPHPDPPKKPAEATKTTKSESQPSPAPPQDSPKPNPETKTVKSSNPDSSKKTTETKKPEKSESQPSPAPPQDPPKQKPKPKPKPKVKVSYTKVDEEIEIYFNFDENVERKLIVMKEKFKPNTKISEMISIVKTKNEIKNEIEFRLNEEDEDSIIDHNQTLESIEEEIEQQKNKKILYVGLTNTNNNKKETKPKSKPKSKSESEEEENEKITKSTKEPSKKKLKSEPEKPIATSMKSKQKKPKPTTIPIIKEYDSEKSFNLSRNDPKSPTNCTFVFVFYKDVKELNLEKNSKLSSHILEIKNLFDIPEKEEITITKSSDGEAETTVDNLNEKMEKFIGSLITIHSKNIKNKKPGETTYIFQTNIEDGSFEVNLGDEATVETFKEAIKDKFDVSDISCIKILFAGKDLLDDIVMKELEVEDTPLYAYIQTIEEIMLLTAYANKISKKDLEEDEDSDPYS